MTKRTSLLALLSLLGGCADATDSPALPSATLVLTQQPDEQGVPLILAATPVQIGSWDGPESLPDGARAIVAARVPQGVATLHSVQSPTIEPSVIGTQLYPRFDFRAVPLLPCGAFWVGLGTRPISRSRSVRTSSSSSWARTPSVRARAAARSRDALAPRHGAQARGPADRRVPARNHATHLPPLRDPRR